MGIRGDDVYMP
jgi:hypothetical protein